MWNCRGLYWSRIGKKRAAAAAPVAAGLVLGVACGMKHQVFITLVAGLLLVAGSVAAQTQEAKLQEPAKSPSYMPEGGFVPNAATAKRIAEAVWLPIYGKSVLNEKPFKARLTNEGVWVVEGSLPKDMLGGVAYIEISRRDGRILEVTHGK